MIAPWVDGIDINCGCPQSWAIKEGIGCSLMGNPHKVAEMVKEAKRRLGSGKSMSCKIRIHKDLKYVLPLTHSTATKKLTPVLARR